MAPYAPLRRSPSQEKIDIEEDAVLDVEGVGSNADTKSRSLFKRLNLCEHLSCAFVISTPWASLNSLSWHNPLVRILIFICPSFLQGRHAREQICPSKLSPTAYLDGMRGLAALFVYFCHYSYQAFVVAEGWGGGDTNYHFLKLPFLRLWYQGPAAVCVFFVISGYALSYSPLKLIRNRSHADLSTRTSSLVFRRGIRLYLPTAISTLMIACLLQLGVYDWTRAFAHDRTYMRNVAETHPARMESIYAQFSDWALSVYRMVHVFGWEKFGGATAYDVHLWTIPVEFRCSLYLFLLIVGTARLQAKLRFLAVAGIMAFFYTHSRWDLLLFCCGMALAEWDLIRGIHLPTPALCQDQMPFRRPKQIFWALVSVLGLYLLCQPDSGGEVTPGWRYLSSIIPDWWQEEKYRYWQSAGAVLFVLAAGHSKGWQEFFNTPAVQYLGKISYALYLMHGPAMHTVGYMLENWAYSVTGVDGNWYNAGFILGACFCVPTVIWWADVFWRAVDIPAVRFAKWLEQKCIAHD
ncbi:hypothetical protein FQN49_006355 [Arthroderma sp. PD_2]|nr:hypothetical protein FQN49_006355 [Arthroderma sp. PD_2]